MKRPAIEVFEELHQALRDLFIVICEELGIAKLVKWLNKKLDK